MQVKTAEQVRKRFFVDIYREITDAVVILTDLQLSSA